MPSRLAARRPATIPLGRRLLASSSDLPGDVRLRRGGSGSDGPPDHATLFGLAPCGVLPATDVAAGAVRSYRTFSPLPLDSALTRLARGGIFSVPLVRQVALPGRYPAHCPSEFGLSSPPGTTRRTAVTGSSDRLADCDRSLSRTVSGPQSSVLSLRSPHSANAVGAVPA